MPSASLSVVRTPAVTEWTSPSVRPCRATSLGVEARQPDEVWKVLYHQNGLPALALPPPLQSPPPWRGGGGAPSLHCFVGQYLLRRFVFPIGHTHVLALLSHHFKSVTCVYSLIFSLQRRCTGCRVPFSDPRCFLPVTLYGTTHTHLVHMCWPLLWGLRQKGRISATFGTYALVGATWSHAVRVCPLEPT